MAINSFSDLKTSISTWLAKGNLDSYIPDFITLAETRIYRELRIKAMEVSLSTTISSGTVDISTLTGYKEFKFLYIDQSPVQILRRREAKWIYEKYPERSADGLPLFVAREADTLIFGPYPDSGYSVKGVYYASLTALSASNETNWFTSNAPDLLLWASLVEAEPFLKNDNRIPVWESKYQQVKAELERQDKHEEFSGSDLTITTG